MQSPASFLVYAQWRLPSDMMRALRRSTFDSLAEAQCFQGIVDWMSNAPTSARYRHANMDSWFYWAYNPDSGGGVPVHISFLNV